MVKNDWRTAPPCCTLGAYWSAACRRMRGDCFVQLWASALSASLAPPHPSPTLSITADRPAAKGGYSQI